MALSAAAVQAAQVGLIKIDGAIGPATASYISRAIDVAAAQSDECLIIQLEHPGRPARFRLGNRPEILRLQGADGGLCVAGAGAGGQRRRVHHHGGGRGGDGAAHAHRRGASGGTRAPARWRTPTDIMKTKIGERHRQPSRNPSPKNGIATWPGPRPSVLDSASITAEEALNKNVIDFIADDMPDLLKQLDGREVDGKTLNTANATVVEIPMNAWERILPIVPAAGGHVHPDADGDLRHHRRIEQSRRDLAGHRRRDCADSRALHVGHPAGQRHRTGR